MKQKLNTMETDSIQRQHKLEKKIISAIETFFEDYEIPHKVLVAISPDLNEAKVVTSRSSAYDNDETYNWLVEEIDTRNLSDNVSEVASYYFDVR